MSQIEQPSRLLNDVAHEGNNAQSMHQIKPGSALGGPSTAQDQLDEKEEEDSEIMLNVPSETMAGQIGVQDARASRDHKRLRQQQKPLSAKQTASNAREQ